MAVPSMDSMMMPILKTLAEKRESSVGSIRKDVARAFNLSELDLLAKIASGRQSKIANRVNWALSHMVKAGLVQRVSRGSYQLLEEGEALVGQGRESIGVAFLTNYSKYNEWREQTKPSALPTSAPSALDTNSDETPEEALGRIYQELLKQLETELLDRVMQAEPAFLEQVIVNLMIAMGYGGGVAENGRVTGRTGDGGVDGTIREDTLGLGEVYIQAKRFGSDHSVGEPDLRNFVGAIDAAGTTKGVFVTTSSFTPAAKRYLERSPKRIVLIDGPELARLMVRYGVGVRDEDSYQLKKVDEDYFELT